MVDIKLIENKKIFWHTICFSHVWLCEKQNSNHMFIALIYVVQFVYFFVYASAEHIQNFLPKRQIQKIR